MRLFFPLTAASFVFLTGVALAQQGPPEGSTQENRPGQNQSRPPRGPGGPMNEAEQALVDQFDGNKNGRLETAERAKARAFLKEKPTQRRRPGPPRGREGQEAPKIIAGKRISPDQVKASKGSIYAKNILRTLFIDFENDDWESELEKALEPIFDIEGALRFLAIECTLMNDDGYWTRASDYNLYRDPKGVFHIIPHDFNEAFRANHGHRRPGGRRGPRSGGSTPLRSFADGRRAFLLEYFSAPTALAK